LAYCGSCARFTWRPRACASARVDLPNGRRLSNPARSAKLSQKSPPGTLERLELLERYPSESVLELLNLEPLNGPKAAVIGGTALIHLYSRGGSDNDLNGAERLNDLNPLFHVLNPGNFEPRRRRAESERIGHGDLH
jgi:hypothetical protein